MIEQFVKTENYTKMYELMSTLVDDLAGNAERMGLGFGRYGLGKTFALERVTMEFGAILLRQNQTWTKSSVQKILARELGIDTEGKSSADLLEEMVDNLIQDPTPIIVDEVDGLLRADRFSVLEFFRDIHDLTGNVFVMVGMESCNSRLKNHPHFYSRIVEKVKFQPIGKADIKKFCLQSEVKIEEDLIEFFLKKYPNLRRIKVFILRLEKWADANGIDSIDLKMFRQSGVEKDDE